LATGTDGRHQLVPPDVKSRAEDLAKVWTILSQSHLSTDLKSKLWTVFKNYLCTVALHFHRNSQNWTAYNCQVDAMQNSTNGSWAYALLHFPTAPWNCRVMELAFAGAVERLIIFVAHQSFLMHIPFELCCRCRVIKWCCWTVVYDVSLRPLSRLTI